MRPILYALIFCLGFLIQAVGTARAISASLPDTVGSPGQSLDLPLTVSDLPIGGFLAFQFELNFDNNLINISGVDKQGSLIESVNPLITTNLLEPGRYRVAVAFSERVTDTEGTLIYMQVQIAADCPDTNIELRFSGDEFPDNFPFMIDNDIVETTSGIIWNFTSSTAGPRLALPELTMGKNERLALPISWFYRYVGDPNDPDETLIWTFSQGFKLTVNATDDSLIIVPFQDWYGEDSIPVEVRDPGGLTANSEIKITVTENTSAGGDNRPEVIPQALRLKPNYPNPFNRGTTITFDLPAPSAVRIEIYGPTGRLVRRIELEKPTVGSHRVRWDGCDQDGRPAPSGVYLCRLAAGGKSAVGKLTILR